MWPHSATAFTRTAEAMESPCCTGAVAIGPNFFNLGAEYRNTKSGTIVPKEETYFGNKGITGKKWKRCAEVLLKARHSGGRHGSRPTAWLSHLVHKDTTVTESFVDLHPAIVLVCGYSSFPARRLPSGIREVLPECYSGLLSIVGPAFPPVSASFYGYPDPSSRGGDIAPVA